MKLLSLFISLYLLSNSYSQISTLTKYGTITISGDTVYFESKDFDDGEDMHFKIQAGEYDFDNGYHAHDVEYYYANSNWAKASISRYVNYKKTSRDEDNMMMTKYFTITKKRGEYSPSNGDYMVIKFLNYDGHLAIITNTEEDEGKIETWVIVVIVVICVAIIAGIIIYCICRRIRMKKAQQAALATNVAAINAQKQANQAAYNYAAQNAAYTALAVENAQNAAYAAGVEDAQNAYLAQQNQAQVYQGRGQTYQAQVYQNNNYTSAPPGSVPDTGYNSKAAM